MTTTTNPADKYLSTADRCRAALKAAGFKPKQVTVKCPDHGSIYVTIRTADVSILAVEAVVNQFIDIRRCEASDEILIGGTSIYTKYAPETIAPLKAEITAILVATPARIDVQIGPHVAHWTPDYGTTATPGTNSTIHTDTKMVVGSQMTMKASGLDFGAGQLATDLLARGIKTLASEAQA